MFCLILDELLGWNRLIGEILRVGFLQDGLQVVEIYLSCVGEVKHEFSEVISRALDDGFGRNSFLCDDAHCYDIYDMHLSVASDQRKAVVRQELDVSDRVAVSGERIGNRIRSVFEIEYKKLWCFSAISKKCMMNFILTSKNITLRLSNDSLARRPAS